MAQSNLKAILSKLFSPTLCLCVPLVLSNSILHAQTWTPTAAGTYDWDVNGNWDSSPFPNAVDASANFSIDAANPQTVNLNQAITVGAISFTDNGATTGSSSFNLATGTSGSLILNASSGIAAVSISAPEAARQPTVAISSDITIASDTSFDTSSSGSTSKGFSLSGNLSGSSDIIKNGSKGFLYISGDNSAFTGNWIINGGVSTSTVRIGEDNNLGAVPSSATNNIVVNNNNTIELSNSFTIHANRNILIDSGTLFFKNRFTSNSVTVAGDISGSGGLNRSANSTSSTGFLTLSGNNTYTGTTGVSRGVLRAGSEQAFSSGSEFIMGTSNNAALNLNDFDNSIGSLSGGSASDGGVTLGTATLTTGSNDLSTNYAGVISGSGGLTKVGTGTMTLDGENTYTGSTTVSAGVLAIGASERISDSSQLVLDGGTFASDGFNETFAGLELSSDSFLDFGAGTSALVFADSSSIVWSGMLTLENFDIGVDTLRFGSSDSALTNVQLSSIFLSGFTASLDNQGFVDFAPIPEPTVYALLAGVSSLIIVSLRRRKMKS